MQELKDILPNHFDKIGFNKYKYIREKYNLEEDNREIAKGFCWEDDFLTFVIINNKDFEELKDIEIQIDYATILTSKGYIDCLYKYKNIKSRERYEKYYGNEEWKEPTRGRQRKLSRDIGYALYSKTIVEFINNITKDE